MEGWYGRVFLFLEIGFVQDDPAGTPESAGPQEDCATPMISSSVPVKDEVFDGVKSPRSATTEEVAKKVLADDLGSKFPGDVASSPKSPKRSSPGRKSPVKDMSTEVERGACGVPEVIMEVNIEGLKSHSPEAPESPMKMEGVVSGEGIEVNEEEMNDAPGV
jgi:hypothetical protein